MTKIPLPPFSSGYKSGIYAEAAAPFCFSEERSANRLPRLFSPFSLSLFSLPNLGVSSLFLQQAKRKTQEKSGKGREEKKTVLEELAKPEG